MFYVTLQIPSNKPLTRGHSTWSGDHSDTHTFPFVHTQCKNNQNIPNTKIFMNIKL